MSTEKISNYVAKGKNWIDYPENYEDTEVYEQITRNSSPEAKHYVGEASPLTCNVNGKKYGR